ncbi:MAG: ABC transporter ATP-binding protein [Thermodesulfobacteriota bacterium]
MKSPAKRAGISFLQAVSMLTPFFRLYWPRLVAGLVALLLVDFLQLLIPRFIKRAVDALAQGTASDSLLLTCAGLILLPAVGIAVCRFLWRSLVLGFSRLVERDLRDRLLTHILTLDSTFFQRHPTGAIMALSSNDLAAVQLACGMGLVAAVDAVVMTVAALCFMAYINPLLTLIAVAPMPVLALSTRLLSGLLHRRFEKVQELFASLTTFVGTTLHNIHLIKAYTQEENQTQHFDQLGRRYVAGNLKVATIQGTLQPLSGLVANCCLLLVLFFGGRLAIGQVITVGDFVAFISYLFMLTWPMMAIGWVVNLFQRGTTSLGRLQEVFTAKPLLADPVGSAHPLPPPRRLILDHLTYSYPGQQHPALIDINVTLSEGIVGLVGKTGSGKSTLCHILARLYPVSDHSYLIDDHDVNDLAIAAVRGAVAYVPQQTILFSETIAFNIALGRPDAGMKEIEAAARAAAIHDEIVAMTDGYQSRIGERGVKLSGGQRQRIALARALLLDRPIIIIDDGLSAVDMETEHAIIAGIAAMLRGKICLIVSHRVAPLADAGEILVMEQGRIAARGTHHALLADNDFYRTIYRHQTVADGETN